MAARTWYDSESVDRIGILGWDGSIPAARFFDSPGAFKQVHSGRGPLVGIPLVHHLDEAEGRSRIVILSHGEIYDRDDWDNLDGRDGLTCCELRWASVSGASRNPLLADCRDQLGNFLFGAYGNRVGIIVTAVDGDVIVPRRPSRGAWPVTQTDPGTLVVEVTSQPPAVVFDVLATGDPGRPAVEEVEGWILEPLPTPPPESPLSQPVALVGSSLDAVRAVLDGRSYTCPRADCRQNHLETLRCSSGGGLRRLGGGRYALPELDDEGLQETWNVVVTTKSAGSEVIACELWRVRAGPRWLDQGRLYWSPPGGHPTCWQHRAREGWRKDDGIPDAPLVPLSPQRDDPWLLGDTDSGQRDAYLVI
ncbi:MAG: hypothetical protein M0Z88_09655 [Actinomycetota bacterium]|nr:hypothetical protein [Actinomycetota bacterium]